MDKAEESIKEHGIFFIKLRPELPRFFFHMARELSRKQITLIPISPVDLTKVIGHKYEHLVLVVDSLSTLKRFEDFKRKFLDMALLGRRVQLHCVTSFESLPFQFKAQTHKQIQFFHLPEKVTSISYRISHSYFEDIEVSRSWPGGKRATLPLLSGS